MTTFVDAVKERGTSQMGLASPSYFLGRIRECRASFDRRGHGFFGRLANRLPPNHENSDTISEQLKTHYDILRKEGRVVWGALAQVNQGMFAPGPADLPGVTVYSTDAFYDENPQDLCEIGQACFEFKNTEPIESEFKPVALRLTDEHDFTMRMPLPRRLTDNRQAFLAATMFHRRRLPNGVLCGSLFPLVIAPEATEVNMVLELPHWSKTLRKDWETLPELLEGMEITSSSRRVAKAAEKPPVKQRLADWDVSVSPVRVTAAMAAGYESIVEELNLDYRPYLVIGLREDGTKSADFAPDYDRELECVHESNGVPIVLRNDQLDRLRGTTVDYRDTLFGKGIVIRLPGE
jgi:hypothetical protein